MDKSKTIPIPEVIITKTPRMTAILTGIGVIIRFCLTRKTLVRPPFLQKGGYLSMLLSLLVYRGVQPLASAHERWGEHGLDKRFVIYKDDLICHGPDFKSAFKSLVKMSFRLLNLKFKTP